MTLNEIVSMAAWTHDTNVTISGYTPLQFMIGKSVTYSGVSEENVAIESI